MKKNILIISLLVSLCLPAAYAQYNETNNLLYNTFRTPQSNVLNAAFFPRQNVFYLSLPSFGFQYGGPMAVTDLVSINPNNDYFVVDLNHIIDRLNSNNLFHLASDVNLVGFGFRIGNLFIDANTRLVADANIGFPKSTINTLLQGNMDNDDNPIPDIDVLEGDLFNAQAYLEGSIGGGYRISDIGLTVGAHVKLLYGIANVNSDKTSISIHTSENFDTVSADIYYLLQEAGCMPFDTAANEFIIDRDQLFSLGDQNVGLAFDLGARWDLGPFTFSLAINDLSTGIHWHHNGNLFAPRGGRTHIEFSGLDVDKFIENGDGESLSNTFDQLVDDLEPVYTQSDVDYYYGIPTKINLGASYTFSNLFRAGIVFHGRFDRGLLTTAKAIGPRQRFRFNTTATVGIQLLRRIELIGGNSIIHDGSRLDFINPGVGLVLTPFTAFQTYVMADYISDFYLIESKAFRINVGLNLLFGKGHNK